MGCRLAVIDSQSFCGLIVAVSAATPRADAGARKPTRPGQRQNLAGALPSCTRRVLAVKSSREPLCPVALLSSEPRFLPFPGFAPFVGDRRMPKVMPVRLFKGSMEKQMVIPDLRWVIALFATIAVLLIALNTAHSAPVHGINNSSIAEASLVEKSVIINRTPRRYSCWWQRTRHLGIPRRICGWHG